MTPQRAAIYVRQSLDHTGEGAAVERQERACRSLADAHEWEIVGVYSDNSVSASKGLDRPAWNEVLEQVRAGTVDVVIAWHMDRITRTMSELETLILAAEEHGVGIKTVTGDIDLTTDTGRMVARILTAVAKAEVERKGARQKAAHQQRAAKGKPFWTAAPFAFNKDTTHREDQADALRQAYGDLIGGSTLVAIAARWNEAGFLTSAGNLWQGYTVRPVLKHPRNAGISTYLGEEVGRAQWDAIVPEETFRAARHLLSDPARNTGGGGRPSSLLTGIGSCGVCGEPLKVLWNGLKSDVGAFRRYVCRKGGCIAMPEEFADGVVFRRLLLASEQWAQRFQPEVPDLDTGALQVERGALLVRQDEAAKAFADGDMTLAQFNTINTRLQDRTVEIAEVLTKAGLTYGSLASDVEYLAQQFDYLDLDQQRALLTEVFESITLLPRGQGRGTLDAKFVVTELRTPELV